MIQRATMSENINGAYAEDIQGRGSKYSQIRKKVGLVPSR